MLAVGDGQLRQGAMEVAAAALVDLTLRGRLGSVPDRGFFASRNARKLIVVDATPTGDAALDSVLAVMTAKDAPWSAHKCLKAIWRPVSGAVQDALIHRGVVSRAGKFGSSVAHLTIEDDQARRAAVHRLDTAWLHPDAVADPRAGAFVDLLRNAGEPFNRRRELEPVIRWEWYPAGIRETVLAILDEEKLATSAASGTGYEG